MATIDKEKDDKTHRRTCDNATVCDGQSGRQRIRLCNVAAVCNEQSGSHITKW